MVILVIFILVVGGIGFYRGWFRLTSSDTAGKPDVTLTVDKSKIHDDKKAADEKANDIVQHP